MTISKLSELAATHDLWNFEIGSGSRRFSYIHYELELRRTIGSLGVIIVRIDADSCDIVKRELVIADKENNKEVTINLTDDQLKDLAFMVN